MTHEAKWASQPWEMVEELMSSPKGALHEIGRLRKRVNELLESNNAYQQAYRDARDLTQRGVTAAEGLMEHHLSQCDAYEKQIAELRVSLDDAERVGASLTDSIHSRDYEIEQIKNELKATGHEFEGDPLHILVDKAIDKERERHQETIVKISTKLGIVFAAGSSYESQADVICAEIDDALVMLRKGWTVYPVGVPEVAMEFKDVYPDPDTEARDTEIDEIRGVLAKTVSAVDLLAEKVEQLMARADNDGDYAERYSAMMQKWLNDLERRGDCPIRFDNLRRRR